MNKEIKEILDNLRKYIDDKETGEVIESKYTMSLILDYITKLETIEQQYSAILSENAELENKIKNLEQQVQDLKADYGSKAQIERDLLEQENKRLTQGVTLLTNKVIDMTKEKENYKSRIDKAIEYIKTSMNNPQPFYEYIFGDDNGDVQNLDKLLKILGGDEE